MGLFEEIHRKPKEATALHLANTLEYDRRALERLLNGCVALGLLESSKNSNNDGESV